MKQLFLAYAGDDIAFFKQTIESTRDVFFNDDEIKKYEGLLIEFAQRKLVLKFAGCFKRVKFNFLGKMLDLEEKEVELLLLKMIFDGSLKAKINQFERYLTISEEQNMTTKKYLAIIDLSKQMLNAISL